MSARGEDKGDREKVGGVNIRQEVARIMRQRYHTRGCIHRICKYGDCEVHPSRQGVFQVFHGVAIKHRSINAFGLTRCCTTSQASWLGHYNIRRLELCMRYVLQPPDSRAMFFRQLWRSDIFGDFHQVTYGNLQKTAFTLAALLHKDKKFTLPQSVSPYVFSAQFWEPFMVEISRFIDAFVGSWSTEHPSMSRAAVLLRRKLSRGGEFRQKMT